MERPVCQEDVALNSLLVLLHYTVFSTKRTTCLIKILYYNTAVLKHYLVLRNNYSQPRSTYVQQCLLDVDSFAYIEPYNIETRFIFCRKSARDPPKLSCCRNGFTCARGFFSARHFCGFGTGWLLPANEHKARATITLSFVFPQETRGGNNKSVHFSRKQRTHTHAGALQAVSTSSVKSSLTPPLTPVCVIPCTENK